MTAQEPNYTSPQTPSMGVGPGTPADANASSYTPAPSNQPDATATSTVAPADPKDLDSKNITTSSARVADSSNNTKFYTITASLREEYDDNIYTTKDNKTGSFVTEFSPSFLINLPMQDNTFSARYTFGLDYYENRHGDAFDFTNDLILHYTHNFSDRFTFDARDEFGYFTDPDLLAAVGTPFRSGSYLVNTAAFQFNAQWTPVFGTETDYSNIALFYQDSLVAQFQNSDENTVSQDFRFAIQPKINFVAGGIFDDIDYFDISRGFQDYTLDVGIDWQALPNLNLGFRAGGTLTEGDGVSSSVSPYAAVTLDWRLGKRSNLSFSYTHNVVPTDVVDAVGQEANRFSLRFNYDVTPDITLHIAGIDTYSDYTSQLLQSDTVPSFSENDVALDLGAQYHLTHNFDLEGGYLLSNVSSDESDRDYTRNQVYVGVRGTY